MIAEELAQYLIARGHGVQEVSMFLGTQPDQPDDCVTVYDETAPTMEESHALSLDQFGVQVLVRNVNYTTARDLARNIHKDLAGFGGEPFVHGGSMVDALFVVTPPTSIGRDDKNRSEWSAHYRVQVESVGDRFRL